jgi:PAS domain S-box-containing protein
MSVGGTKRTRVRSARSESEEYAFVSQAPMGMAQIGPDGTLLFANDRYCQILGYSEAELRKKTLQDLTHPDDWDAALRGRDQLLAGEISVHAMEKRYIRKDGTIFWGRLHRSLMRDRDGAPKCIIAVVEDITEKIRAERALRDSEQRLLLAKARLMWGCGIVICGRA